MDLKTFYQECVKRKVFKGISIYAISSWLIIQVAATTFPYLGFPSEAVTTVIILVLICFPVSILFSWYYNVVPEPEDEDADKPSISKKQKESNKVFYIVISLITILVLILIFMVSRKNFSQGQVEGRVPMLSELASDQIAVLQFSNNSIDPGLDVVGKMVADWIAHGIIQYEIAPVVNYESINQYAAMGNGGQILEGNLNALGNVTAFSKMIRGAFFLNGDDLIFQSEIIDRTTGEQFAFPKVTCPKDEPLIGVETLKQQILSYFLGPKEIVSGQYVPLYDAYKEFIIGRDYWRDDYNLAESHLDQSLEIDPNFYRAAYYKTIMYYNLRLYAEADSLASMYSTRFQGEGHDKEWFDYLKLLMDGRYVEGVEKYEKLFRQQPSNLYDNGAMMVCRYNLLNQTARIDEIYSLINEEEIDYEKCSYCRIRSRIKLLSEIDLGNYQEAMNIAESKSVLHSDSRFSEALIKTYVFSEQTEKLDSYFLSRTFRLFPVSEQGYLYYLAGREYAIKGDKAMRNKYVDLALSRYNQTDNYIRKARCYYLKEEYTRATEFFIAKNEEWKASHNGEPHVYSLSRLAAINQLRNLKPEADALIQEIQANKGEYDYGYTTYLIAHVHAISGNKEKTIELLEQSLLEGKRYGNLYFQNDPHLREYFEDPGFKKLLSYWH
ncbi:MAG: hypothetical protein HKN68_11730 [Saprospiraceae bacterium]|nr:hypothetical protein [Saprospiraceae bacterium]